MELIRVPEVSVLSCGGNLWMQRKRNRVNRHDGGLSAAATARKAVSVGI